MSSEFVAELEEAIESSFTPENEPENKPAGDGAGNEESESGEESKGGKDQTEEDIEGEKGGKKDGDDDTDEKEVKPPVKSEKIKRSDKRVDELLKQRHELQQRLAKYEKSEVAKEPELPQKPDPRDYKYDPENPESKAAAQRKLDFDMGKWEAECDRVKNESKQKKESAAQAERERIESETVVRNERIAEDAKRYKDYDAKLPNIAHLDMTEELHDALLEIDNPAAVMRFFNNRPDIADKVLSLPSHQQSRQIMKISMKLELAEKKVATVSKAPAPPAKTPSGGSNSKPDGKMSAEEYFKKHYAKKK